MFINFYFFVVTFCLRSISSHIYMLTIVKMTDHHLECQFPLLNLINENICHTHYSSAVPAT